MHSESTCDTRNLHRYWYMKAKYIYHLVTCQTKQSDNLFKPYNDFSMPVTNPVCYITRIDYKFILSIGQKTKSCISIYLLIFYQ